MDLDKRNKRVILITGDSTKWYEQAIFIVNKNISNDVLPINFVDEAEKIIDSYMTGGIDLLKKVGNKTKVEYALSNEIDQDINLSPVRKAKVKSFNTVLNLIMLFSLSLLSGMLFYLFFKS